jgi:rhodanese-related sulfurtransferase
MRFLLLICTLLMASGTVTAQNISTEELEKYLEKKDKIFFLDVREPAEIVELGSVPGYVNIPVGQLEKRLSEVPKDKLVITL